MLASPRRALLAGRKVGKIEAVMYNRRRLGAVLLRQAESIQRCLRICNDRMRNDTCEPSKNAHGSGGKVIICDPVADVPDDREPRHEPTAQASG